MARAAKILCLFGSLGAFTWTVQLFVRAATLNNGPYDWGAESKLGSVADLVGAVYLLFIGITGLVTIFYLTAKPGNSQALLIINLVLLIPVALIAFTSVSNKQSNITFWSLASLGLIAIFLIAVILTFSRLGPVKLNKQLKL